MIEINNLSVDYGKMPILKDFSLTVNKGDAILIKGPSGCGKSTLLHTICGLIPRVIDANVTGSIEMPPEMRLGIVFQNPATQLFCDTVEDEIAFGLENICTPPEQIGEKIKEMLDLVQMAEYRYSSPKELSGGQKQRVVLAAVLALEPQILLLDEALSQLDFKAKGIFLEHLKNLRKQGRTMLMVDHDDVLAEIATKIINL